MTLQQAVLDDSGKDELAPAMVIAGYIGTASDLMDLLTDGNLRLIRSLCSLAGC
jgi:hypothetical protein